MGIGSVGASLNILGTKTKVIWIDAHADINTMESSPSGNIHGMPLSFLTKLDNSNDYDWIKNRLKFENLCYIGIRDLDPEEIKIIKTYNIKTITVKEFNTNIIQTLKDLILWAGISPIHISLDVDSLDPKFIEYTGTRVPGGIEIEPLIKFINTFCKFTNVVNVDISELNLNNPDCVHIDKCERTKSFGYFNKILKSFCSNM